MVGLTMTAATVAAIRKANDSGLDISSTSEASEPSLVDPAVGHQISHGQIIALFKVLRHVDQDLQNDGANSSRVSPSYHLDELLRGAKIYKEPPNPKAEPVSPGGLPNARSVTDFLLVFRVQSIDDTPPAGRRK